MRDKIQKIQNSYKKFRKINKIRYNKQNFYNFILIFNQIIVIYFNQIIIIYKIIINHENYNAKATFKYCKKIDFK